mgnify:CR=1 FL=1
MQRSRDEKAANKAAAPAAGKVKGPIIDFRYRPNTKSIIGGIAESPRGNLRSLQQRLSHGLPASLYEGLHHSSPRKFLDKPVRIFRAGLIANGVDIDEFYSRARTMPEIIADLKEHNVIKAVIVGRDAETTYGYKPNNPDILHIQKFPRIHFYCGRLHRSFHQQMAMHHG